MGENVVLTEEMLDSTGARLYHSPCKSLAQLAQQVHVSKTMAWRVTKSLQCKIRQVQVIEEGVYERWTHFCNVSLWAVHDGVRDPHLTFCNDEAWFHLSGCISAKNRG
jgi:hypothetical protein